MHTLVVPGLVLIAMLAFVPPAAGQRPPPLALTIPAWPDGAEIPLRFTQATPDTATYALGMSPELRWENVPEGTESFVLLFRDVDVSRENGTMDQTHWLLWNIPGTATGLPEGLPEGPKLADGTRQVSVSGPVYRGPGAGANGPRHHYVFELFALDIDLIDYADAEWEEARRRVFAAMEGHVIGKAAYVGLFRRPS